MLVCIVCNVFICRPGDKWFSGPLITSGSICHRTNISHHNTEIWHGRLETFIEILKKWKQNYLNWRSQSNITLTSIDCRNPHISRSSTLYPDKAWRGFYFSLFETLYFVPWSDQGAPDDLVSPSSWLQSELRNLLSPGGQWSSPHWNRTSLNIK